jgi:hypothetical protein
MAQKPVSDEDLIKTVDAYVHHKKSKRAAARSLGMARSTFQRRLNQAALKGMIDPVAVLVEPCSTNEFEVPELPCELRPVEQLIAERKSKFNQLKEAKKARECVPVRILTDGPIGLAHVGDPHVDSDGCDIAQLERDANTIRNTPGLYAGNVGDTTNNWTGRLAHLWQDQSTSGQEQWQLAKWFLGLVKWLYMIGGNHNCWSNHAIGMNPIEWIINMSGQEGIYGPSAVRFELNFPNGRKVTVNARHDFPGNSMWNPAHGASKAAQMGYRDNILVCGHKHKSGYNVVKDPSTKKISHCLQVATYKTYDTFAEEKGFIDANITPCPVTIIDPEAKDERGLITMFWDIERAADYLNFLRGAK